MRPALYSPIALGIAVLSGPALAVGFGEMTLHSRIGEPLRAEVAIVSDGREPVEMACFSLAPMRDADLPVVSAARLQLVREGRSFRLLITGKPVADPLFMIALRAGCGVEFQRDFVLVPQPPTSLAETEAAAAPALPPPGTAQPVPGRKWRAREGDSLESLAEGLATGDAARQQRMLAALQRANPRLATSASLPEGTPVRIPRLREAAANDSLAAAEAQPPRPAPPPRPKAPAPRPPTAGAKGAGGDRLVLSAPPEDLLPSPKAPPPRGSLQDMEERMLKMETTLHQLNDEIGKLNQALALTTEALTAQQQLQAAQAAQAAQTAQATAQPIKTAAQPAPAPVLPATAPPHPSADNWIEMLLSALVGGIVAASAAHVLVLRRRNRVDDELPLAVQAAHAHHPIEAVEPALAPVPPLAASAPTASEESEDDKVEVTENDSDALLRIAEIMLAFGRVRDAAETLSQYIKDAAPNQVQPWVMLLDLYRRGNLPQDFAILASRIRERFNVQVPTWDEAKTADSGLKSLEHYPHIANYLKLAWGKQECMEFLHGLVNDNRAGQRIGFPLEVVEEIVLLMRVLEDGYGIKRL